MVIKLGIVGISEGNGHPFSYSALINGYSEAGLKNSGWDVIYNYIRKRDLSEFGFNNVKVTHAWTQDKEITQRLCAACLIPNAVEKIEDMIGQVDGVIFARDDYENHYNMVMPFLKENLYVFVDKPLALNIEELKQFKPYLEQGKLMSCSGMRYAKELDEIRQILASSGAVKLIRGTIVNSWEKYGVHLLDAIFSVINTKPVSIRSLNANHQSMAITLEHGALVQIDCIENGPKLFKLDILTNKDYYSIDITDNFSMFRRALWHFVEMIKTDKSPINLNITLTIMLTLIAGLTSSRESREVLLDEYKLI